MSAFCECMKLIIGIFVLQTLCAFSKIVGSNSTYTNKCDGVMVRCFASPCASAVCDKYPEAICIDDYCGGCNARFFHSADTEYAMELDCGMLVVANLLFLYVIFDLCMTMNLQRVK